MIFEIILASISHYMRAVGGSNATWKASDSKFGHVGFSLVKIDRKLHKLAE
jgi:hypothetical protein